jgi:hypothetical protein
MLILGEFMPAIPPDLWSQIEASLREKLEPKNEDAWAETWAGVGASGYVDGLEKSGLTLNLPTPEEVKNLDYSPSQKYFIEHGAEFIQNTTQTDLDQIKASLEANWGDQDAFVESLAPLYSEDRLLRIYRAELHMSQNGASLEAAQGAGMKTKTRHAIGDERTCDICMSYDGESVGINDLFEDGSVEGHSHPACRCAITFQNVEKSSLQKYGTPEGVERSWDTRGRGRKEEVPAQSHRVPTNDELAATGVTDKNYKEYLMRGPSKITLAEFVAAKQTQYFMNRGDIVPVEEIARWYAGDKDPLEPSLIVPPKEQKIYAPQLSGDVKIGGIKPSLQPIAHEALKYDTFEEFRSAYTVDIIHGRYWHVTDDPNFKIDPTKSPVDYSSMATGGNDLPGLMISSDPKLWVDTFPRRKFIAEIDMSAVPKEAYRQINRGFGNEFWVEDLVNPKVKSVLPKEKALRQIRTYDSQKPQSPEELKEVYDKAWAWKNKDKIQKYGTSEGVAASWLVRDHGEHGIEDKKEKRPRVPKDEWQRPPVQTILDALNATNPRSGGIDKILYEVGPHERKWASDSKYVNSGEKWNDRDIVVEHKRIDPTKTPDVARYLLEQHMYVNKYEVFPKTYTWSGPTQPYILSSFFNMGNTDMPKILNDFVNKLGIGLGSFDLKDEKQRNELMRQYTSKDSYDKPMYGDTSMIKEFILKVYDNPAEVKKKTPDLYDAFVTRLTNGNMDKTLTSILGFKGSPIPLNPDPAKNPLYKIEPIFKEDGEKAIKVLRDRKQVAIESAKALWEPGKTSQVGWDDDEYTTVRNYKGNGFKYLNAAAMGIKDFKEHEKLYTDAFGKYLIEDSKQYIAEAEKQMPALDRALAAGSMPIDAILYRGVNELDYEIFTKDIVENVDSGSIIRYMPYMSTTLEERGAAEFAGVINESVDNPATTMIMKIHAPKGTKGLYIEADSDMKEFEWLLPRKTMFNVLSKSESVTTTFTGKPTRRILLELEVVS